MGKQQRYWLTALCDPCVRSPGCIEHWPLVLVNGHCGYTGFKTGSEAVAVAAALVTGRHPKRRKV